VEQVVHNPMPTSIPYLCRQPEEVVVAFHPSLVPVPDVPKSDCLAMEWSYKDIEWAYPTSGQEKEMADEPQEGGTDDYSDWWMKAVRNVHLPLHLSNLHLAIVIPATLEPLASPFPSSLTTLHAHVQDLYRVPRQSERV
jgi:hypothetical protein